MKVDCDVVRDLLPLYADDACSGKSREMVEDHLQECQDCLELLHMLQEEEIENNLLDEKESVIQYALRSFRRRSAAVGSAVSGLFMIPILACLLINLISGPSVSWVYVVVAALCVAASLIAVPLLVPEDKLFWTFCAFCANGDWFWITSSAVLFGLSVIFLPFVIRARPIKKLIGNSNRLLIVLGLDAALFLNMLNMISTRGKITLNSILFTICVIAGIAVVIIEIIRKRGAVK